MWPCEIGRDVGIAVDTRAPEPVGRRTDADGGNELGESHIDGVSGKRLAGSFTGVGFVFKHGPTLTA